jgi:hypothetical protein
MRIQSAFEDMKSTGFAFGIRLPNRLTPSAPRPMASVSHSDICCAVVALCKAWMSNSLCSSTIQSKGKYAIMHRCYGDESGVTGRLQRLREVIVHVHDSQDQWAPTSVNRRRIYRKPITKSDASNMQFFIVRDDFGNETNMKNLMGVHFCSLKGCQLIAKLNRP